jgi:hypothetical protein
MSIFAKAAAAPQPKTNDTKTIATAYAGVLVVLAVAQLFTFDEFLKLFVSFELPGVASPELLAALIVAAEVFALPFLLRMALSPAFRFFSMLLGWFVAGAWVFVTTSLLLMRTPVNTVGLLGTAVDIIPSWWAVLVSCVLVLFAAWAAWGMWPLRHSSKKI